MRQRTCIVESWTPRKDSARALAAALLLAFAMVACERARGVDTQPLSQAGLAYDSVKQLQKAKVTTAEITDILKMHDAGFSDDDCVQIVQIFHGRGQIFDSGNAVAGLIQAGVGDRTIVALANLNQLGRSAGEFEAMHLAGLSDAIVLEIARHRSEGKPALSGVTLARLKNTGLRGSTLLELARRDIPDSEAAAIMSFRRRGASDAQILRRFSGS